MAEACSVIFDEDEHEFCDKCDEEIDYCTCIKA